MNIIKLDATDSTNRYLKDLVSESTLPDFTTVVAKTQTQGRGQMGASWQSEKGKNLTVSILKLFKAFEIDQQFDLNMAVSLGLYSFLRALNIPNLSIKWPNDILSGSFKICGILIENTFSRGQLSSSVIGIGLNVNQQDFENLPKASSMMNIVGRSYDLDELLPTLLDALKSSLGNLALSSRQKLKSDYEKILFLKDRPGTFKDKEGQLFSGIISGVSKQGHLQIQTEMGLRVFNFKEVTFLY